ncbi:TolC family protein [Methylobacillus flagellatus]|uniref:TolC family protein n=1 Tax=Methylobacillus flagellatus TaxID=405 RepID=UPI002868CAAC|nr:TolC family protein [Methylobacillus flagellatus]
MKTIKRPPGLWTTMTLCSLLATGCGYQQYQAHLLAAAHGHVSLRAHDTGDSGFLAYLHEEGYASRPEQWGWQELIFCTLYFHPDLDVARAQLSRAMAAITTAAQRPNPSVSIGAGRRNEPEVPEVYSLSFSIPVETAGKRQARIDMASNLSESARLNIAQTTWNLRYRLLSSWIEFNAAHQNLSMLKQEAQLRDEIVSMLTLRLQAGMISSVELSNARLQWQKAQQTLVEEQGRIDELKTQLASNAGLPLDKFDQLQLRLHATDQLLGVRRDIDITNALNPAAQDAALLNRVDIRAGLANYAASEARLRLEIARQYPDISLAPAYNYEEGFHIWSLGISSLLNVLHRNQGQIAEAKALRETEAAQFEALQARVIASMDSARSRYRSALLALEQARGLYEAQQTQAQQASLRFEHGFADRLELFTYQLENVLAKQRLLAAEYQVQRAAAALEDSMQLPLENLDQVTAPSRHSTIQRQSFQKAKS